VSAYGGLRPFDKITIEEYRLEIASQAGRYRTIAAGAKRTLTIPAVVAGVQFSQLLAANRQTPTLYVEIRARLIDGNVKNVYVNNVQDCSPVSSARLELESLELANTPFAQVLLPGEELWIAADPAVNAPFDILVLEVQV
jgi:hypothetical protein